MPTYWHELLAQLAIIAATVMIWTNAQDTFSEISKSCRATLLGFIMGVGTVALMLMPLKLADGLLFDLRSTLLSMVGFFGGPLAALIAVAIALTYRVWIGGIGAPVGCAIIVGIGSVGIVGHKLVSGRAMKRTDVVLLAAMATLGSVLLALALPASATGMLPANIRQAMASMIFISTILCGMMILQEDRRRALRDANGLYRAIIEALPDCLNAKDGEGRFLAANPATARLMKAGAPANLVGKTDFDFYPNAAALKFWADERAILASGETRTIEQKVTFADGSIAWLATLKAPFRDKTGTPIGIVTHNRDITDEKRLRDELKSVKQLLEDAMNHMADGLVLYDREGTLLLCNQRYSSLFPKTADLRVPGARLADIIRASAVRGEDRHFIGDESDACIARGVGAILAEGDRMIRLDDGRSIEARTRRYGDGGALILMTDVTERKRAENALMLANDKLARLAVTDSLTELTNRRGFDKTLAAEFALSSRSGSPISLLMIDVDQFKAYNDAYGHLEGDTCLKRLAETIRASVSRSGALVARYGGEEFAAILPNTSPTAATEVAESLRIAVRDLKIPHAQSPFGMVTVSVGIGTYLVAAHWSDSQELIDRADHALYAAKAGGRDRVCGDPRLLKDALPRRLVV